ncbi:polymorphic toxin-type HINT domain-containing protein [Streptomyces sp. NPDC093801]|uniref:polymorphic toxin-type HINT domain-containing protein n=1 Tax=Streptomyces sp. NPDC093801 TaxID=3155203 RepID=UPI00344C30E1
MVLTAGLLSTSSATAQGLDEASLDREEVVDLWKTGGAGVREAAERALLGTDDDIQKFLDGVDAIQYDDDYVDASRVFNVGGTAVREATKAALQGTPEQLREFLRSGWQKPLQEDREVEASRAISSGGNGVKAAGKAALQAGPAAVTKFLEEDQYRERETDNEVEVSKLIDSGGPNMKAAGKAALQGTPDDVAEFLEVGQFVARNRDQEHATIEQLTEQAKQAGQQAEEATKKSEEASARAVAASSLAKEAAQKAARETEAARKDAGRASVKAQQAADAARAAAAAAQQAISSANAASRSARIASLAAAQTANAAAQAAKAANDAYNAAIAAGADAGKAEAAKQAAAVARNMAFLTRESAKAAEQAGKASEAAGRAADASRSASTNATAAADAAEAANGYADAAGVHSAEARNAAAEARRHANAANRAANNAGALARRSANAAFAARDAANTAANHAEKAAQAAEQAAKYAGQSANAAEDSRKYAEAAKEAAEAATTAVNTARTVHEIALAVETEELAGRAEAALERSRSEKAQSERLVSATAEVALQDRTLDATAAALAAEAAKPDVDVKATATKGRKLALDALKLRGPWSQQAAATALAGSDAEILEYLRTGWQKAGEEEARDKVLQLSVASPYPSIRQGAGEALKGTPQQIADYYAKGQYETGKDDLAVAVSKVNNTGGPSVKEASKAALATGNGKDLAIFLEMGQYAARLTDEEVIASKLVNSGGDEVKAAAKAALAGTPEKLHEFVTVGQYTATRKDDLTDHHRSQIDRLLSEGEIVSAKAQANRWRAAEAAATAKQAAGEAAQAAGEAKKSADAAAGYAVSAKKSAEAAEASSAKAKQSANTARNAAAAANRDADTAEASAAQADFSAGYARQSASKADNAALRARASALAAGKSKDEAEAYAGQAWVDVKTKREAEIAEQLRRYEEDWKKQAEAAKKKKPKCIVPYNRDSLPPCMMGADADEIIFAKPTQEVLQIVGKVVWELSGGADIEKCIKEPAWGDCALAIAGVLPVGKLKLVKKVADGIEDAVKGSRVGKHLPTCAVKPKHSFPAGTRVLMGDNTTRSIEQLAVGDQVLATDPETGVTGPRRVDATIYTPDDREFTTLTLDEKHDGGTLTTTDHHPFWSENEKKWKNAADLTPQDTLRANAGDPTQIAGVRHWISLQPAYNLTVNDLHTYYVLAGTTPVLVHNDVPCETWSNLEKDDVPIPLERVPMVSTSELHEATGRFVYVVLPGGELRVTRLGSVYGHIDLAQGADVAAAGEIKLWQGRLKSIDNRSGHYQPKGAGPKKIAEDVFREAGFEVGEKTYKERW